MPSLQPLAVLPASIDGHEPAVIEDNTRIVATYARHTSIAILTSSPSDRELGIAPGWQKPSAGGHLHNPMIMEYESGWRDLIVMDRDYRGRKAQLSRFVHDCRGMYLGTPLDESNCAHDRSLAIHLNNNLVLVIQRVRSSSDVEVIEIADRLDIAAIDAAAQRAGLSPASVPRDANVVPPQPPLPPPPPSPQPPPRAIVAFLKDQVAAELPWSAIVFELASARAGIPNRSHFMGHQVVRRIAVGPDRATALAQRLGQDTSYIDGDYGCVGVPFGVRVARGTASLEFTVDCGHLLLAGSSTDHANAILSGEMMAFLEQLRDR